MNKKILFMSAIALSALTFAQVGINTETPSATLDIVSSGSTNTTKALEINNSAATEMVTVLDNGNVGIGTTTPNRTLHVTSPSSYPMKLESGSVYSVIEYQNNSGGINVEAGSRNESSVNHFYVGTGGAERMRITNLGNVGIGTTSPSVKLDVFGAGDTFKVFNGANFIKMGGAGSSNSYISSFETNFNIGNEFVSGALAFRAGNAERMRIISSGSVGIGTSTPSYTLDVVGDINSSTNVRAGGLVLTSDARLKTNIVPMSNGLTTVMRLNPVSYDKKASLASTDYNTHEYGFLAQELQKVLPTLVGEGNDAGHTLSVNYVAIIPVLVKAIQEQQAQIEALKAKK